MLSCREMTKLISDSLESKLSIRQRMELWFHIMMCGMCRRFRANIIELRKRLRGSKARLEQIEEITTPLPQATKSRLEAAIKQQLG